MLNRQRYGVFWLGGLVFALAVIVAANIAGQNTETTKSQGVDGVGTAKEIRIPGRLVCLAEAMHDKSVPPSN